MSQSCAEVITQVNKRATATKQVMKHLRTESELASATNQVYERAVDTSCDEVKATVEEFVSKQMVDEPVCICCGTKLLLQLLLHLRDVVLHLLADERSIIS